MEEKELEDIDWLKEIDLEGEDENGPKLKKNLIFVIAIFLILLIISYIFVGSPLSVIIRGQLESTPLNNNRIDLDDFAIVFENNVQRKLQAIYFAEQKVEFSVCLAGRKTGNDYYITSLYRPKMYRQAFNYVSFAPCSENSLIILHSHPYKSCLASQTDLNSLRKNQEKNKGVLMIVMCEPERFSVYR